MFNNLFPKALCISLWNDTIIYELLFILLWWCWHRSDFLVHLRLSETWFIHLVVSIVSITDHVYEYVFSVFHPILYSEFACFNHCDRIWSVDSEYRNFEWFDNVSRVFKAPVVCWLSREAYLVIRDYMYGATTGEVWQFTHSKSFIGSPLSWECWVSVRLNVHD